MPITRAQLRSAEDRYRGRQTYTAAECYVAEWWLHSKDSAGRLIPRRGREMPKAVALDASVEVHVNRGRWLVACPGHNPDGTKCWAAQMASREDHRFHCSECGNHDHGGAWLIVEWPADAEEIEAVLGARPAKINRNWDSPSMRAANGRPSELLSDLQAENADHGVL